MRRGRERGTALVAVMLLMGLLMAVGAVVHTGTIAETTLRGAHARATSGFYAAEAGINRGMGDYRNIFLSYAQPTGSDFDEHSFALGPRDVKYQLTAIGDPNGTQVTVPAGRPFAGLNAIAYKYTARATSEMTSGEVEVSLGTEFDVDYIPLFQFLAFFQGDLEILPGPNMNLHGPIHTNGDLFLNCNNTLTIEELLPTIATVSITAAGDVVRGRKDSSACNGTVQVAKLNGTFDQLAMSCSGPQSDAELSAWLGSIRAHQPVVAVPQPDVLERGSGEFWAKADLRIVLDLDSPDANGRFPIVVQDGDAGGTLNAAKTALLQAFMGAKPGRIFYNDVPSAGMDAVGSCSPASAGQYCHRSSYAPSFASSGEVYACARSDLYDAGAWAACPNRVQNQALSTGGVTARRGGFYNNRESAWVYMLNVNVHDLLVWNRAQGVGNQLFDPDDTTEGGVVLFLSVKGPNATGLPNPRYGARVFGTPYFDFPAPLAADPTGVTIVTDHGLYVEGDYNVGHVNYPKQPAAVMGDTMNVLSNAWTSSATCKNDCQTKQVLNPFRQASTTNINAAFLAGHDLTVGSAYNGGLENYPRFHERWSGQALNYLGSFVSLGVPVHHNGQWIYGGMYYEAPVRNWDYDTDFQTVALLPPLTPRFVSVEQILFTENFR